MRSRRTPSAKAGPRRRSRGGGGRRTSSARKSRRQPVWPSAAELRNTFNRAGVGIFRCTPEGKPLNVNPALARLFGYETPEAFLCAVRDIGRQLYPNPADRPAVVARVLSAPGPLRLENRYRTRDGREITVELYVHVVRDRRGRARYIEGFAEDITRQKEAEESILRAQARLEQQVRERTQELRRHIAELEQLRDIINRGPAVVFFWRLTATPALEYVSNNVTQWGYTPADLCAGQEPGRVIIHPDDWPRVTAAPADHFGRAVFDFHHEYRVLTKSGEARWVSDWTKAVRDANGACTHYQSIVLDITEHRRALLALRENETRFRSMFEGLPVPTYTWRRQDDDFVLSSYNKAALEITEGRIPGLVGQRLRTLFADDPQVWEEFNRCLTNGTPVRRRMDMTLKSSGKPRVLDVTYAPVPPDTVVVHTVDVTEEHLAVAALRESEVRFRQIAEVLPVGLSLMRPDLTFEYLNPCFTQIFGYTLADLPDKHAWFEKAYPDPARRAESMAMWRNDFLVQPVVYEIHEREFDIRCKDGTEKTILLRSLVVPGGKQVVTYSDVTAQRAAERALRENEARYRQLFDTMQEGLVLHELVRDAEGRVVDTRILDLNPAAERIMGNPREKVLGRRTSSLVRNRPPGLLEAYASVADSGKPVVMEAFFQERNKHLLVSAFRVQPNRVAALFSDITARKQQEARMLQYQQELRELALALTLAEERIRHDLSGALHDSVAQTLALAKMRLDALVAGPRQDPQHQDLEELRALLDQALTETRTVIFHLSPPLLYEIGLQAALEWLGEVISQQSGLPVRVSHAGPAMELPEEPRVLLYQIARELLLNVVKHARADRAEVHLHFAADSVSLTVADNGRGLDVTAEKSRVPAAGHFGLFSIRERLRHVGGTLEIDSAPGQGTSVTVQLPLAAKPKGGQP